MEFVRSFANNPTMTCRVSYRGAGGSNANEWLYIPHSEQYHHAIGPSRPFLWRVMTLGIRSKTIGVSPGTAVVGNRPEHKVGRSPPSATVVGTRKCSMNYTRVIWTPDVTTVCERVSLQTILVPPKPVGPLPFRHISIECPACFDEIHRPTRLPQTMFWIVHIRRERSAPTDTVTFR